MSEIELLTDRLFLTALEVSCDKRKNPSLPTQHARP